LFGVDASTVYRDIAKIEPAVKQSIPISAKLYTDSNKINNIRQLQELFPELITITHGTNSKYQDPKLFQKKYPLFK